ncbi:MAG TPA: hypothetical protein VNQ53_11575 [Nocardioides sp.]|nr:hypothetical protein [Nocardioides sp.]
MSDVQVVPTDMKNAENAATEAADGARGHGSSGYLRAAGGGIPGADSMGYLSELAGSWDKEITTWADNTDAFGAQIAATSNDAQGTDKEAGGLFGGLFGLLGGS